MSDIIKLFAPRDTIPPHDQAILCEIVEKQRQGIERPWVIKLLATGIILVTAGLALTIQHVGNIGGWLVGIGTVICFFASVRLPLSWSLHDSVFLMTPIAPEQLATVRDQLSAETVNKLRSLIANSANLVLLTTDLIALLEGPATVRRRQANYEMLGAEQLGALSQPK